MCGIFACIGECDKGVCVQYSNRIAHRGPEETVNVLTPIFMAFHRLRINGTRPQSSQPFYIDGCYLMCNGEIYNHRQLVQAFNIQVQGDSDCEVICHLYRLFGLERTLKLLDGVFALILYDERTETSWVARDKYGVRQLFIAWDRPDKRLPPTTVAVASEAKALIFLPHCRQVLPGSMFRVSLPFVTESVWFEPVFPIKYRVYPELMSLIRKLFTDAVRKRTMSDRPIGCLLSGGLDSSLIAAVLQSQRSHLPQDQAHLHTFSIGLTGSPDLEAARKVATFLGTAHHEVVCSIEEMLDLIPETVYVTGSYDVTTIRASVWHYRISQYVRDNTSIKVVFSGEYSDEQNLSYLYGANAPSEREFYLESIRLLQDIGYFDNLRGDHCISACGLEARVPFADHDFMQLMLSIPPELKMFGTSRGNRVEKHVLREAFTGYLPKDILWRRKNGFSDSVSPVTDSWSTIIQRHVDTIISDEEFAARQCDSATKEAYWYKKTYLTHYPESFRTTPYQWLPKWCGNVTDPSARALTSLYRAD